jgi:hypothetical protein
MYLANMIIIIWLTALAFAIYMMKRNVIRTEKEHERRRERFNRLLEQLKKPTNESETNSEKKEQ